ncbi:DMT family transporter [Bacillus thuringiensis]|uniref:DMT family transporter n=1 Tax=Bacillus TaxID=1386 RepID=UPI000BF4930A|nr:MULTISPECIES: DMT family transporter [Bacillus cereus group]MBV6708159.1 DMT family transporter [Bacillus thuringiensis]PFL80255.1 EamA family transporter [Bacillus cereus]PFN66213.1 EamA family transporter [Bacillus cereus]HEK9102743.1 EamA family transporter [Bacillus pseudomycoides]
MEIKWDFRVIVAYGLTIFLWASAFPGIRVGLESYTPEHLALFRLLIGSALLVFIAIIIRMRLPQLKDIPAILLLGFLGFTVYHTALNIGEKTVSAGVASLLVSTTPIFSALLAVWFLRERFGLSRWTGSVISFLGVALISFATEGDVEITSGILFILLASFSESVYFVFQTRYLKKYGFFAFTTYTIWAGTFFMLFFLPGLTSEMMKSSIESTLSIVYLGLFPTVIPYLALAYVTSRVGASEATSSLYLTPALAFVIAWIWLGEVPTLLTVIGGGVTLFGVLFIQLKVDKFQQNAKQNIQHGEKI